MTMDSRPYRVALHGAYRTDNFGDMLLMLLYKRWVLDVGDAIEVRMPFVTDATARHLDPGPARGARALLGVDSFVYGGGGYFGEPPTDQHLWGLRLAVRHLAPGLVLGQLGRDVVVSGVGAGPVGHPLARTMLARVARRASLITVRDEPSRAFLVELGVDPSVVRVTADAALTLRPGLLPAPAVDRIDAWLAGVPAGPRLGVHLAHPSTGGEPYRIVLDDVVAFARARPEIRLVPLSDQHGAVGQLAAMDELVTRLPGRCTPYRYQDPWDLCALLERLDLVITSKLHVGIVAAALGAGVLSYPRHPKVSRFFDQIGAPDATHIHGSFEAGQVIAHLEERFGRAAGSVAVPDQVRAAADVNRSALQQHLHQRVSRTGR